MGEFKKKKKPTQPLPSPPPPPPMSLSFLSSLSALLLTLPLSESFTDITRALLHTPLIQFSAASDVDPEAWGKVSHGSSAPVSNEHS